MPHLSMNWTRLQPLLQKLLLGLLVLGLAACAAGPRKGPQTPATPAPIADRDRPPPPPPQNKVALLVPTTGSNAAVGQSIANATSLALLDLGNQKIKLTVYNTANGPAEAARRALAEGNKLFLGPLLAPDVRAVQPIAERAQIPLLTFSNDASLAGNGTYVLGFQPDQSMNRVVAYARSRGVERYAALVPSGIYGERVSAAFLKAVRDTGGRVNAVEIFTRDRAKLTASARRITDYEARVARASQGGVLRADGTVAPVQDRLAPVNFQALLIADTASIATAFTPALQQYGAKGVRILGPELWASEPGIARVTALHGAWFASVPDARFEQMADRYSAKFGGRPSRLASLGYDAVLLIHSLADRWTIGEPFPRAALSNPDGFAGVDGIFRFTSNGVAERGLEVQQVGPEGFTTVSPAPKRFGE